MVDVHPPIHGWREFLVHLITITIGLLIALGPEGTVEWLQGRHLLHQAQTSLRYEITANEKGLLEFTADLHRRQKELGDDVTVLQYVMKNGKLPKNSSLAIGFHITTLDDVAWRTAQSTGATGAVSRMSYAEAEVYSEIYATQVELNASQKQAARDAIISLAPFVGWGSGGDADDPTPAQAADILQKVQVFAGQLQLGIPSRHRWSVSTGSFSAARPPLHMP